MSSNLDIRNAFCQMASQSGLVPIATVASGGVLAGQATVTVTNPADAARFVARGVGWWQDLSGELPTQVKSVAGSVITFDFTGHYDPVTKAKLNGWRFNHPAGSIIATNLLPIPPNPADASLTGIMHGNGYPVIRAFVLDSAHRMTDHNERQVTAMLSLVYQLPGQQPEIEKLHAELFVSQQTDRAENDAWTIVGLLNDNWVLKPPYVPIPGQTGGSAAEAVKQILESIRQNVADQRTPLFEAYLDVQVLGNRQRVRGASI